MKRRILYITLLFGALLASCSSNEKGTVETDSDYYVVKDIKITGTPVIVGTGDADLEQTNNMATRSIAQGTGANFSLGFLHKDSVGIFAKDGAQIPFALPVAESDTVNGSTITAEGWNTKVGTRYSVYHPYNFDFRYGDSIPWDFRVIQKQKANNDREHIGKYWFLASNTVEATVDAETGTATFLAALHDMGAILRVQCVSPAKADYRRAMIVADDTLFATHGVYNLFDETGTAINFATVNLDDIPLPCTYQPFHAKGHTDHVTLDIESAPRETTGSNRVLTTYFAIPETDLRNHNLTYYIWDSDGNMYVGTKTATSTTGRLTRNTMRTISFTNMHATSTLDVTLNDWEKEELCPTCTPVAW